MDLVGPTKKFKVQTKNIVAAYLTNRLPRLKNRLASLQAGIKSPVLSPDKVQTSFNNYIEDNLIESMDLNKEVAAADYALNQLDKNGDKILKMLYVQHKKQIDIATSLSSHYVSLTKDSSVRFANSTFKDELNNECMRFADLMYGSGFDLFYHGEEQNSSYLRLKTE
ncbi:hypothetical protein ACKP2L_05375 [Oenococcus alcoholitolerans]